MGNDEWTMGDGDWLFDIDICNCAIMRLCDYEISYWLFAIGNGGLKIWD